MCVCVCVLSPKTVVLGILMRSIGNKNTILLGLGFQILQLAWYGFGSQPWSVPVTLLPAPDVSALHTPEQQTFRLTRNETLCKCRWVTRSSNRKV